jgi:cysteine desulfurase / selenocysteine lyase
MDLKEIKKEFPIFTNQSELVFLDNSSTTQKPNIVLNKLIEVYTNYNSNVHRGLYPIAEKINLEFELAREKIAKFINADKSEVIFTSGTTQGINFIAQSFLKSGIINNNSKILTTTKEHHSNFLPFQNSGATLTIVDDLSEAINSNEKFDIVVYSIVSNVTGEVTKLESIKRGNLENALFIADAAQAVGHINVDVKKMNIDVLAFSGHKMFGPTGIGILYVKKSILDKLSPVTLGGGIIKEVKRESVTFTDGVEKFEAGTPSIADAIALGAATDFIQDIGIDNIEKNEQLLKNYLLAELDKLKEVTTYHNRNSTSLGIVSFTVEGVHPHDIAQFLGDRNICVRAGHHCTQILHKEVLQIPASVRVSISIYNTVEDIDKLIAALRECIKYYGAA